MSKNLIPSTDPRWNNPPKLVGDGVTDDTEALQWLLDTTGYAWLDVGIYKYQPPGQSEPGTIRTGGRICIKKV